MLGLRVKLSSQLYYCDGDELATLLAVWREEVIDELLFEVMKNLCRNSFLAISKRVKMQFSLFAGITIRHMTSQQEFHFLFTKKRKKAITPD